MNVPEAAERLRAYYASSSRRSQGGFVHIIVEDSNTEQHFADSCLRSAKEDGDAFDVEIAQMLADMSRTQRKKLSRMHFLVGGLIPMTERFYEHRGPDALLEEMRLRAEEGLGTKEIIALVADYFLPWKEIAARATARERKIAEDYYAASAKISALLKNEVPWASTVEDREAKQIWAEAVREDDPARQKTLFDAAMILFRRVVEDYVGRKSGTFSVG